MNQIIIRLYPFRKLFMIFIIEKGKKHCFLVTFSYFSLPKLKFVYLII